MRFFSTLLASTLGTLIAFGILFFFSLIILIGLMTTSGQPPHIPSGSVLVLPLQGTLPERVSGDPFMRLVGEEPRADLHDLRHVLRHAAGDDRIEGIWLQIGPLEASWAARQELVEALIDFKRSGKFVVASLAAAGFTEADYYIAATADSLFGPPEGLFEFNGFYLQATFFKNLLDRLEIEPQVIRAGRYKNAVEPFLRTDFSPESEEQLSSILASIESTFYPFVAEQRGLSVEALKELAGQEALFSADQAARAGLLDGLAYEDEIRALLRRRLGRADDERLPVTSLADYLRLPDVQAGYRGREAEIAVVYALGPQVEGDGGRDPNPLYGGQTLGTRTFVRAMQEARDTERVRAVVVRIDSPGGLAPAADAMRRAIELTAQAKPVIVSMGGVAASGGYWMATAADTIVADPLTLTGSIGVFSLFINAAPFLQEKLGITTDVVRSSPFADMLSGLRALTPAERRLLERSTDSTYATFLRRVAEGRHLTVEQVAHLAEGRVWTGIDALRHGLVDVMGGLETAIDLAAERAGLAPGSFRLRELPRPRTLIEELNAQLQVRIASLWDQVGITSAERQLRNHLRLLHDLLADHRIPQARLPFELSIR